MGSRMCSASSRCIFFLGGQTVVVRMIGGGNVVGLLME